MTIADVLKKLEELRQSGAFTDEEFAAATAVVIARGNTDDESAIEAQIDELRRQKNEIERLDRAWQRVRQRCAVAGKPGQAYIPGRIGTIVNGIVTVGFGIAWVSTALVMGAPWYFPWIGVAVVGAGIAMCAYLYAVASAHDAAYERYRRRRAALLARHGCEIELP